MKDTTLASYEQRLQTVLDYIATHLQDPMPLEELARIACFSPYHFHRVFTGMMGVTLKEYVRQLRLERAAEQLTGSETPVTDIAFDAGYESPEAFTRAFRTAFGTSPRAWRTEERAGGAGIASGVVHGNNGIVRSFLSLKEGTMEISVRHFERMRVACVSHTGPYENVGSAWGTLFRALFFRMLIGGRKPTCFGIVHDDPEVTEPEKIRYDACVRVSEKYRPGKDIHIRVVEEGDYAVALHKGPYHEVGKVYAALCGQWLPASGYELCDGPALEFYLNNPRKTAAENLLTEICLPVRRAL